MNSSIRRFMGTSLARWKSATRATAKAVSFSLQASRTFSSAVAMNMDDEEETREKHCQTCTCQENVSLIASNNTRDTARYPCGQVETKHEEPLPPPLPSPKYSVHKRVLPKTLTPLNSPEGRRMLLEALSQHTGESYWTLMEHFCNQSDPAYCGVTTLLIVLNSMSVDPNIRWRGGWRYFGNEDTLLKRCCLSEERIQRVGITMPEFARLAKCQGLGVTTCQPNTTSLDQFRKDLSNTLSGTDGSIVVVSFARSALGQTGEGHFSPVAALYKDQVLVLDVARFKYAPYWVSVEELYNSMLPLDEATQEPRGWFVLKPPPTKASPTTEARRPAHLVPTVDQADICPIGDIKVHYCKKQSKE